MPINPDGAVLSPGHHRLAVDVHPETHSLVALYSLKHLFVLDIPEDDISIFAGRGNECFAVEDGKTAADGEFLIAMTLIRLFDASGNIVP